MTLTATEFLRRFFLHVFPAATCYQTTQAARHLGYRGRCKYTDGFNSKRGQIRSIAFAYYHERGPEVGVVPGGIAAVPKTELGLAQRLAFGQAAIEILVKTLHQRRGRRIIDVRKTHRDVACSRIEKGARQPQNAYAIHQPSQTSAARRERDQVRVQLQAHDLASSEDTVFARISLA